MDDLKQPNLHRVPGHVERVCSRDGFGEKQTSLVTYQVCTVLHAS